MFPVSHGICVKGSSSKLLLLSGEVMENYGSTALEEDTMMMFFFSGFESIGAC